MQTWLAKDQGTKGPLQPLPDYRMLYYRKLVVWIKGLKRYVRKCNDVPLPNVGPTGPNITMPYPRSLKILIVKHGDLVRQNTVNQHI